MSVLGGKCCICGYDKCSRAMDFLHLNEDEKEFGIASSNSITMALDKQLIELRKCVLLCANCHREVHYGMTQVPNQNYFNEEIAQQLLQDNYDKKHGKKFFCLECGKQISSGAKFCSDCFIPERKVERPTREKLKELIRVKPFTQIGAAYDVSDNAVRKWCDAYNLPRKKSEINKISDEDWEKI